MRQLQRGPADLCGALELPRLEAKGHGLCTRLPTCHGCGPSPGTLGKVALSEDSALGGTQLRTISCPESQQPGWEQLPGRESGWASTASARKDKGRPAGLWPSPAGVHRQKPSSSSDVASAGLGPCVHPPLIEQMLGWWRGGRDRLCAMEGSIRHCSLGWLSRRQTAGAGKWCSIHDVLISQALGTLTLID